MDNRTDPDAVKDMDKIDVVLDCAGLGIERISSVINLDKLVTGGSVVSLSSPMLSNTDKYGLIQGTLCSMQTLLQYNMTSCRYSTKWAFFQPDSRALDILGKLVEQKIVLPTVSEVFNFDNSPGAYQAVEDGSVCGKIVIDMSSL